MKKVFFVFLVILFVFPVFSDVYRYKDENGKVYIVDSIYQVPLNYRDRVEVLPSGKDVIKQEKAFQNLVLKGDLKRKIGDSYFNFILDKIKGGLIVLSITLLLIVFLFVKSGDFWWYLSGFLLIFLLVEFSYLFYFYPETKKATRVYSYLTQSYLSKKIAIPERVKKFSLENAVMKNPVPLNPYGYFKRVSRLKDFYNSISLEALIERDNK